MRPLTVTYKTYAYFNYFFCTAKLCLNKYIQLCVNLVHNIQDIVKNTTLFLLTRILQLSNDVSMIRVIVYFNYKE